MGRWRRFCVSALLGMLLALLAATPAAADPATPTNYRSEIIGTEPTGPFTAEVIGGDAFVRVAADAGADVVVLGYEGEPAIWFSPDGTVFVNTRSASTYLNDDRYGAVALPGNVDPNAEPVWDERASGGVYSWHDHRTHWMSRRPPSVVESAGGGKSVEIFEWTLPLLVDGDPGAIEGRLSWIPSASPVPWSILAIASAIVAWFGLRRWPRATPAALTAAGMVASVVAIGALLAQPANARTSGVDIVAPIVATTIGAYALARLRSGLAVVSRISAVGAAALIAWALLRIDVLTRPLVPTLLAPGLARLLTGLILGTAVGTLATALPAATRAPSEAGGNTAA